MVTYMLLYRMPCSRVATSSTNAICANRWRKCYKKNLLNPESLIVNPEVTRLKVFIPRRKMPPY